MRVMAKVHSEAGRAAGACAAGERRAPAEPIATRTAIRIRTAASLAGARGHRGAVWRRGRPLRGEALALRDLAEQSPDVAFSFGWRIATGAKRLTPLRM